MRTALAPARAWQKDTAIRVSTCVSVIERRAVVGVAWKQKAFEEEVGLDDS